MLLWPPSPIFNVGRKVRKVTILFSAKSNIDKGGKGAISKVTLPSRIVDIVRLRDGCHKLVLIFRSFTGIAAPLSDWLESYTPCNWTFTYSTNDAILLMKRWKENSMA